MTSARSFSPMQIPLEDNFEDILGKAQRGLQLDDATLAASADIPLKTLHRLQAGIVDEAAIRAVTAPLRLGEATLLDSAQQAWYPASHSLAGLACFNTPFRDMHVNAYLLWDPSSLQGAVFDTGATAEPILQFVQEKSLQVSHLFITHAHRDHVTDLRRLRQATGAPVHVSQEEPLPDAEAFAPGATFAVGSLQVETRRTSGHSEGGITYVVHGLERPVAVVGDAIFAGSMGGGLVSYADALSNNREQILTLPDEAVLCPGHGPLTTVGEEKRHNPFFPEFQQP